MVSRRGMFGLSLSDIDDRVYSRQHGRPMFSATMSRDRFLFLLSCLNFDDALEPKGYLFINSVCDK